MSMADPTVLELAEIRPLLERAAFYEMLARAFAYPDDESVAELGLRVEEAAEQEWIDAMGLRTPLGDFADVLRGVNTQELAGDHNRLFSGQTSCSAHETEFEVDTFVKARRLADISGFYRAFGLKVTADNPELPDFISTELEFMGFLIRKQAYAVASRMEEERDVCADAQAQFLQDHLGRWMDVFRSAVVEASGEEAPFYPVAAHLCAEFIGAEVGRSGVQPRPFNSRVALNADAEPFTCGSCEQGSNDVQ